jgi:hypothetical protein
MGDTPSKSLELLQRFMTYSVGIGPAFQVGSCPLCPQFVYSCPPGSHCPLIYSCHWHIANAEEFQGPGARADEVTNMLCDVEDGSSMTLHGVL